jgi:hypothetical protein
MKPGNRPAFVANKTDWCQFQQKVEQESLLKDKRPGSLVCMGLFSIGRGLLNNRER